MCRLYPVCFVTSVTCNVFFTPQVDAEKAVAEGWWYKPPYIINELNINSAVVYPRHGEVVSFLLSVSDQHRVPHPSLLCLPTLPFSPNKKSYVWSTNLHPVISFCFMRLYMHVCMFYRCHLQRWTRATLCPGTPTPGAGSA